MAAIPIKNAQEDCEHGGKESMEDDNVMDADKKTRLLLCHLLTILDNVLIFLRTPLLKSFIHQNGWMLYVAYIILPIGTFLAPIVKRRAHISLIAFTVAQSYIVAGVLYFYLSHSDTFLVLGLDLTKIVLCSLAFFALYTKRDFTFMKYWLVAGLSVLTLLTIEGVLQIVMQSYGVELLLVFGGAIHFSLYLIIDTQQIITNLSSEEYFWRQVGHYVVFYLQVIIAACVLVNLIGQALWTFTTEPNRN